MDATRSTMPDELVIPGWANGPDGSANGGYAAGLLASASGITGAVDVSLRLPPPLDTPLRIMREDDVVALRTCEDEPRLVGTARATSLADLVLPDEIVDITVDAARAAALGFPYRDEHPFPRCLCCGITRDAAQPELAIHCGPVDGTHLFADAWVPEARLVDEADATIVSIPAMWSALDCPSAAPFADADRPAVLARFEVELEGRARIGEQHVLIAWERGRDGRKLSSASVLVTADGTILGRARALWIEVPPS